MAWDKIVSKPLINIIVICIHFCPLELAGIIFARCSLLAASGPPGAMSQPQKCGDIIVRIECGNAEVRILFGHCLEEASGPVVVEVAGAGGNEP